MGEKRKIETILLWNQDYRKLDELLLSLKGHDLSKCYLKICLGSYGESDEIVVVRERFETDDEQGTRELEEKRNTEKHEREQYAALAKKYGPKT